MSVIFGTSGNIGSRQVQHWADSLSHRFDGPLRSSQDADGLVAFGADSTLANVGLTGGGGLLEREGIALALAGFLTRTGNLDNAQPPLEQLYQGYRRCGIDVVRNLRGAFVLAIKDGPRWFLVRDGSGARTLYYAILGGELAFAIETKSFRQLPGYVARLRPAAVAEYLTFSFVPGGRSMLQDVWELPPGHILRWSRSEGVSLERWFRFEFPDDDSEPSTLPEGNGDVADDDARVERFRQLFGRAIRDRLPRGNGAVGLFLSGGIDSSVVAAELSRQSDRPVRSYAVHFGREYPNELSFASEVARACGTQHTEVMISPRDFLPRMRKAIWHLDQPIGDPITVPNFELADRVASEVRIIFNGEGGDPCFGGPKNLPMMLQHWYGGVPRDRLFRERAYLASYRRAYEELQLLVTPEFQKEMGGEEPMLETLHPFFYAEHPNTLLDKLTAINIRLKGGHLILPKVERMLAASRCVPLSPLFDEDLVRFSFQLPARLKLAHGVEKIVLKRAYRDCLPESVIRRPKSGMRVPVHFWFQKEMRRYARKILSRRELQRSGIWNWHRIRQLAAYDTEEGRGRYGLRLWMLLTFEIWRRIAIENEPI